MQNNGTRSFGRDIVSVFSSNIFAIVNALLIDIVLSRQLGPEGRGLYNAILVVPLIVAGFVLMGIRRSAVYHIGKKVYDIGRTVSAIFSLFLITSLLAVVVSFLGIIILNPVGLTPFMLMLALLSIPVKLYIIYTGGIYIGVQDFKRSNKLNWLPLVFNFIGVLLFVYFIKWYVEGALLALFISNLAVSFTTFIHLKSCFRIRLSMDRELWSGLVRMGMVYAIAMVVMQLNYRIDILFLEKLSTLKEVGYYSLGVAISDKLWQLPTAIGIVVMSRTANTDNVAELDKDVASLVRLSFLIVLIAACVLWLVIPVLLPLFFGSQFAPSIEMVRFMLPGIVMFVIVRILSGRFAGSGEPKYLIALFVPTLIINIILNLLWIPPYGGLGAAMATNVSYGMGAIGMLILFSIKMKVPFLEVIKYRQSDFGKLQIIFNRWLKR